jgi:toxin ParE1/3/4
MQHFQLTNKALDDLKKIAVYTQKNWGVEQRNNYVKQLDETFHLLGKSPKTGNACDYIKPGYRKFPHGSHIIFYCDGTKANIKIVRILHRRMDVLAKLNKDV